MKRAFLVAVILIASVTITFAQDTIFTKDKQELTVKIVEQTNKLIKYQMIDYEGGPILSMKKHRIEKVKYQNGYIDLMGNQNPRYFRPIGISVGLTASVLDEYGFYIMNLDYFITPQIDLQINIGSEIEGGSYYSVGSKFHFNRDYSTTKFTPYTGFLVGASTGTGFIQIPLGVNYLGKKGFNASLSISEMFYPEQSWQETMLELTLGWKFRM